jgi:hypothetical protein
MEVELAETDADAIAVHRILMMMDAEGCGPVPADPADAMQFIFEMMHTDGSCVLMAMDEGALVGTIGLCTAPFWLNLSRSFISDRWLYVIPSHRDGSARKFLMRAAQQIGDDAGAPVYITINNGRRKRGPRSEWERLGATIGYQPLGAVIAHFPED